MRIVLKHQIILAPAAVLLLLSLLLGFLQYSYWSLSHKRELARELRTHFIALAEADMAVRRIHEQAHKFGMEHPRISLEGLEEMAAFHNHFSEAVGILLQDEDIEDETRKLLHESLDIFKLQPGFDLKRALNTVDTIRPVLAELTDRARRMQRQLGDHHAQEMDSLVARTALISTTVLGLSILLGVALSLTLARRLRRRIQNLSDSARRISEGHHSPPPHPPGGVQDELDDLAVSIARMADGLIRTVGSEKLLEGAEEERRRIAMDLHDQTLSDLSSILRGIQDLQKHPKTRAEACRLEENLQGVIADLRDLMNNLHPQTLDILGLEAALESHLERIFPDSGPPSWHLQVSPRFKELQLGRIVQITLFRIAVEACHNVLKHARANRVEISLDVRENCLSLAVEDNGQGLKSSDRNRGGRGLLNMEERARAIGARTQWKASRFSSGTRFELILPLKADEEDNAWT